MFFDSLRKLREGERTTRKNAERKGKTNTLMVQNVEKIQSMYFVLY
jgi:hypothetical protein